jgi:hypothetical protein
MGEGRRNGQVLVALDLWFDGRGAKAGGGASVVGEQLRECGGVSGVGKRGDARRRTRGERGHRFDVVRGPEFAEGSGG